MCGRYAFSAPQLTLLDLFGVTPDACDEPLEANYNVAPTDPVYAVLTRRPRGSARGRADGPAHGPAHGPAPRRQLRSMRWGLVPSWAKDARGGARLINARSETVHEKPAYRGAFTRRRCLLPADGYYEWRAREDRDGRVAKDPVFIRPRGGGVMPMAGMYDFWRDPAVAAGDPDSWLVTCTIITTRASDDVGRIHDRMPMTIEPDRWEAWLDPDQTDPHAVRSLLVPAARGRLEAYPVGREVNNVRNNGPHLVEPIGGDAR